MKRIFGFALSLVMLLSLTGCNKEGESSSEQTTTESAVVSDSGGSTADDELAQIMAEHPDAEAVTEDDGTIIITYYDPDRVVVTIRPDGTGQIAHYSDISEEYFPSYDKVQAEYPGKTVLVWAILSTGYERNAPFRTREVNKYLDGLGCGFAVCFKPIATDFNADNYPNSFLAPLEKALDSGEQVDLLSPNGYDEYVFNGLYERLDGYLETDVGRELYGAFPEKLWESLKINGGIYGVTGTDTLSPDWGYFVNAELAEKYGYDITKPITEQLDILKAVKENEEGVDAFSMYLDNAARFISNSNIKYISSAVYWNGETHSAECALDDPVYMERLRLYDSVKKIIYDDKSILNDMLTGRSKSFFIMVDSIEGGSVGYDGVKTVEVDYDGNTVTAIPVFRERTMVRNSPSATGIYSKSAHKEEAFELLTKIFSDPALNNLLVYGIEGEDYVLENGTASEPPNPFNVLRFANPMICHPSEDIPFTAGTFAAIYESAGVYEDIDFELDPRNIADELNAGITAAGKLSLSEITSLDDVLSEYREGLYAAGLQTIIDECNRQYEIYLNEKD